MRTELPITNIKFYAALAAAAFVSAGSALFATSAITNVELKPDEVYVKVKMPVRYDITALDAASKLSIDLEDTTVQGAKTIPGEGAYLDTVKWAPRQKGKIKSVRVVMDLKQPIKGKYKITENPDGLRITFGEISEQPEQAVAKAPAAAGAPAVQEEESAKSVINNPNFIVGQTESTSLNARSVTLNLNNMPLRTILNGIAAQTGATFIIDSRLEDKKFSANMNRTPLRDALRALLEVQGLGYEQIGNSNTFAVKELSKTRLRLVTRIFNLRYTQLSKTGSVASPTSSSSSSSGGSSSPSGLTSNFGTTAGSSGGSGDGVADFIEVIRNMLSEQGKLQVYPQTNSLIISDIPENFPTIEDLIEKLDMPIPQVMIEAQFVETNADLTKNLGINYGASDGTLASFQGNATAIAFPVTMNGSVFPLNGSTNVNNDDWTTFSNSISIADAPNKLYGGISMGVLSFQQLTAVLKAIETTGDGQYLSKPKVLTLNNKPAEIGVTANTVVEFQTDLVIGTGNLGKQTTTAKRSDTGITMWVTPQVNEGGMITMSIMPVVSRAENSTFFPSAGVVDTHKRYINTTVRVKDGSTVMIGGLMENDEAKTIRRVPLLGHIPIIGYLFSSVSKTNTKRELLIFITPRVVVQ